MTAPDGLSSTDRTHVSVVGGRVVTEPKPGYWAVRQHRQGPLVPACIRFEQTHFEPSEPANIMDRSPILTAYLGGEIVSVHRVWQMRGDPISREIYDFMLRDAAWVKENDPSDPKAHPEAPVDWSTVRITF